jgi:hypothetical protein
MLHPLAKERKGLVPSRGTSSSSYRFGEARKKKEAKKKEFSFDDVHSFAPRGDIVR